MSEHAGAVMPSEAGTRPSFLDRFATKLVALLQNTQTRSDEATQQKLNAIADALSDLMNRQDQAQDARELRLAVGLEKRESS
ncbi:hypothetical protein M8C13_11040 [Crossiella sp. SN42]|uniref:hypothetical protein n=1 Tax=Crossiella sp. SN42 TaxID=2944808 RepID=UPI00207D3095|nr:hypothetical protein [Crossiella sp. SN42]MCO1576288.1 hypothetical protein [Crossiella sp. SN42]